MSLIINFFGGPGIGKSTQSADLFSVMKKHHMDVELTFEFPKIIAWEENYSSIKDLKGKTVGLGRYTSVSEEFDRNAGSLFKVDFDATTYAARFLKLAAHRSDVIVYYTPLNATALEKKINQDYSYLTETQHGKIHHKFCVINNPIDVTDIHFALSKRLNSELIKQINLALQKAKRKGLMSNFVPPNK